MAEEDMLFGKNRHFYGGIEPSNMKAFTGVSVDVDGHPGIKLVYTLPDDTIVNGQTLCSVAGAVIRRKSGSYPVDEFDGTFVADVMTSGETVDTTGITIGQTYYYRAFPYTTQGVYRRDASNGVSVEASNAVPPGNMKTFTLAATIVDGVAKIFINAVLPDPTIVDGIHVNEIAGVIIRRGTSGYPTSETDGTLVINSGTDVAMYDTNGITAGTTYYYSAFPYTTDGLYNRDPANRAQILAGGTPPGNMVLFRAANTRYMDRGATKLRVKLPPSTDEYTVAGCMIRRTAGGTDPVDNTAYPQDINDGDFVMNVTTDGSYFDQTIDCSDWESGDVQGKRYCYAAFPYTTDGTYLVNPVVPNVCAMRAISDYLLGFAHSYSDNPDPTTSITYDLSATSYPSAQSMIENNYGFSNFSPIPGRFNEAYKNSVPVAGPNNMGSWDLEPGEGFMPRPCVLKFDGTVKYYLDPNDYTKKIDGTPATIDDTLTDGNVMLEWPKIYMDVSVYSGVMIFVISSCDWTARTGKTRHLHCWCNYDKDGNEIDHFYTSVYPMAKVGNNIRSLSGRSFGSHQFNAEYFRLVRSTNGSDWDVAELSEWNLIQTLMMMTTKSLTPSTIFGGAYVNGVNYALTGHLNTAGMFGSDSSASSYAVKVFGMEFPYADQSRAHVLSSVLDTTYSDTHMYVKLTRSTVDGTSVSDYWWATKDAPDSTGMISLSHMMNNQQMHYLDGYNLFDTTKGWGFLGTDNFVANSTTTGIQSTYMNTIVSATSPDLPKMGYMPIGAAGSALGLANTVSTGSSTHTYQGSNFLACHPSAPTSATEEST